MASSTHPAFAHGTGLSHLVWHHLHEAVPLTVHELQQLTGLSADALRSKLRLLAAHDLAHRELPGRWTRRGNETTLDRAADTLGSTERIERRNAQLDRDCEAQRHYLTRTTLKKEPQ